MGGVERMKQNIAYYRIGIRWKKWCWLLITRMFIVTLLR